MKYVCKAIAGFLCFIFSLLLYIHMYCWNLLTVENVPVEPFLNRWLIDMEASNISFIATVAFTFTGLYLFFCTIVGNIKVGMRFYFVTFYPML